VAGERGELRRFLADGSDGLVADPTSDRTAPRVISVLAPVPAWHLLVGDAGNDKYFFDATTRSRSGTTVPR